jgi:hypothetical protein
MVLACSLRVTWNVTPLRSKGGSVSLSHVNISGAWAIAAHGGGINAFGLKAQTADPNLIGTFRLE